MKSLSGHVGQSVHHISVADIIMGCCSGIDLIEQWLKPCLDASVSGVMVFLILVFAVAGGQTCSIHR